MKMANALLILVEIWLMENAQAVIKFPLFNFTNKQINACLLAEQILYLDLITSVFVNPALEK